MSKVIIRAGLAGLAVLALAACAGPGGPDGAASASDEPSGSPHASGTQTVGDVAATTSAAAPPAAPPAEASAELDDGRHPGLIKTLDVPGLSMSFDLVEFLTGDAAKDAYLKEFPTETDGPPNDYWIVNVNPRLRTLAIATDVVVIVTPGGDPSTTQQIPLAQLPAAFHNQLDSSMVWLTVAGGKVTKIEQQWVP